MTNKGNFLSGTIAATALSIVLLCSCKTTHTVEEYTADEITMGYNGVDADTNNFAVSKVKPSEEKSVKSYSNMYDYLQGRVPGMTIRNGNITIRGIGTNGDSSPLILVDGLETSDISNIDPQFVSSVEVLKDASASMYGVRGANGVILITTKKK